MARTSKRTDVVTIPLQVDDPDQPTPASAIDKYLATLDADRLRALLTQAARSYDAVATMLQNAAALESGDHAQVSAKLMEDARAAVGKKRVLYSGDATLLATRVRTVLTDVEQVIEAGAPDAAAPVAQWILTRLANRLSGQIDDRYGAVVRESFRAKDLYLRACAEGKPDQARLARWLLKYQFDSYVAPEVSLAEFRDILGTKGMQAYRRGLDKVIESKGGPEHLNDWGNYKVRHLAMELAEADGDVDFVVQVLLSGEKPQYERAVDCLLNANRPREAMSVLDRAFDEYIVRVSIQDRSRQWTPIPVPIRRATELYLNDGRNEDALDTASVVFRAAPTVDHLDVYLSVAKACGTAEEGEADARRWIMSQSWPNGDTPVALALALGDIDFAWQIEDRWPTYVAWRQLADYRPQTRWDQAIGLYQQNIEQAIKPSGRESSRHAAMLAHSLRDLCVEADIAEAGEGNAVDSSAVLFGHQAAFEQWLADFLAAYRRRPTVAEEFAKVGL